MQCYPWQKLQWEMLVSSYRQGRLPHALLLTGPRGLGKKDFACAFSNFILCENEQNRACEHCRGCRLFIANSHPDFFLLQPEADSKTIKVDQIRELTDALNQTAQRGGYQVVVVEPAENMNRAASNAFLKTLEEPSGKVLLMLVSHQPGNLPKTILSRCQKIPFINQPDRTILDWLRSRIQNADQAEPLLRVAHQAPLRALEYDKKGYLSLRNQLLAHLVNVSEHGANPIESVQKCLDENLADVLNALLSINTDLLRLHLGLDETFIVNRDCFPQLQRLYQRVARERLMQCLLQCQEARRLITGTIAVNQTLLLESVFLRYAH